MFTAYLNLSPVSATSYSYFYYIATQITGSSSMSLVQQATAPTTVALTSMWLMEESVEGPYTTLDGRKWKKVYEYTF